MFQKKYFKLKKSLKKKKFIYFILMLMKKIKIKNNVNKILRNFTK